MGLAKDGGGLRGGKIAGVRNVESKYACPDHELILGRALADGAKDCGFIEQRDVFFDVPQGRLKLRYLQGGHGQLIAYTRDNLPVARPSEYGIFDTAEPQALEEVLDRALSRGTVLEKRRHLLLHRHTRIHLDEVLHLGRFVELETVIDGLRDEAAGSEHEEILEMLDLSRWDRIGVGYVDLLETAPPREIAVEVVLAAADIR